MSWVICGANSKGGRKFQANGIGVDLTSLRKVALHEIVVTMARPHEEVASVLIAEIALRFKENLVDHHPSKRLPVCSVSLARPHGHHTPVHDVPAAILL